MATITPSEGGTFSGEIAEALLFQGFTFLQFQEGNESINPNGEEFVTGVKNNDTDNRFFEGTWKIPANFSPKPLTITAGTLYEGLAFSPGTGGTFTGATLGAYLLEVILWIIQRQNNTNDFNPDKLEYVTASYNANQRMWEGTFKLPYQTILLPNGGVQDTARAYLL